MSNQKTLNIVFAAIIVILAGVIIYFIVGNKIQLPTNLPISNNGSQICIQIIANAKNPATGVCQEFSTPCDVPKGWIMGCSVTGTNPTSSPSPQTQSHVYENQYMKVTIPAGWSAKQVMTYGYVDYSAKPSLELVPVAVNITKGNYILYINAQGQQASGINGGRFNEIAQGAPSVTAVGGLQGQGSCGTNSYNLYGQYYRTDYYISKNDSRGGYYMSKNNTPIFDCTPPSNGTVWYFSFMSVNSNLGGFFNQYIPIGGYEYVITMAYNSKDVNKLPKKGSTALNDMLSEMTDIVKTLVLKQK